MGWRKNQILHGSGPLIRRSVPSTLCNVDLRPTCGAIQDISCINKWSFFFLSFFLHSNAARFSRCIVCEVKRITRLNIYFFIDFLLHFITMSVKKMYLWLLRMRFCGIFLGRLWSFAFNIAWRLTIWISEWLIGVNSDRETKPSNARTVFENIPFPAWINEVWEMMMR